MKYPIAIMLVSSIIAYDLTMNHGRWTGSAMSVFSRISDFLLS